MKKTFGILLVAFMLQMGVAQAATTTTTTTTAKPTDWTKQEGLDKVTLIGTNILSANKLPTKVKFVIDQVEEINAYANADKEVHVYLGLLKLVQNNDELAGVIAHEISHIVLAHSAKQTFADLALTTAKNAVVSTAQNAVATTVADASTVLVSSKLSRTEEFEADLTGTELMIKAGYNPLGMISVLNKITSDYADILQSHPSGDKRVLKVYDFVTYNYPATIKPGFNTQSYKDFLVEAQPTLDERKAFPKKQKAYEKEQKKLNEKRIKQAKKMRNTSNPWDTSFNVLKSIAG